ncbi:ABC transporter permease [Imtechella halotolerans]|uniref:ABC transporter permease n=1 Tax=Imtechella halotolerans K1 TaxID=946077 RepID=I0W798_9FLAO|nr:ABC transporter permease [Imtechella halotolerans]EID72264.1 ABC transporter permease [Imtechella halotolerans K1]WMQ64367.1 ABC transporter permease [Imtechella halotolerans]
MWLLLRENIRIALDSIKSQLLRTILTILIIAIGITALVGILSVVTALKNTLSSDFASMGANTFSINRYDTNVRAAGGTIEKINPPLSYIDAKEFKDDYNLPYAQTSLSFTASMATEVKYENLKTDPEVSILGVDDMFLTNSGLDLSAGRDFTSFDISNNINVCIVGSDFEKNLFKDINPLDKTISLRGAKFKVIGVLKSKGSTFGNNQDLRVLIPLQSARSIFTQPNVNYRISVKVSEKDFLEQAQEEAILTMRNIRSLSPVEENNFGIERSDDLIQRIGAATTGINIAGFLIGLITIFGSSIALLNIMLVSVTERTKEIGIRKALGAKRNDISFQFFMETIVIAQIGGLVGILLGIGLGYAIASALSFKFIIPWGAIVLAISISFIVAIISGLYPAIKASRLDPVEALRYE